MAKGGSGIRSGGMECQEAAGEHRRSVADSMRRGRGYRGCRPSCTNGLSTTRVVGSMTCSTSSTDPAFLVVAWERVRGNRGARTAGVDGVKPRSIVFGERRLLAGLRDELKARRSGLCPCGRRLIPKKRTGSFGARDPHRPRPGRAGRPASWCSSRSSRRTSSRAATVSARGAGRTTPSPRSTTSLQRSYEWVLEGDIKACFDEISHVGLMGRVRDRIGDQARPVPGQGVPQSRYPLRGRHRAGHDHRHSPRRDPLAAAQPTWPSLSSTIISPRPGRRHGD